MRLTAIAFALVLTSSPAWSAEVLTPEGLGPVKIGMTRTQVQKALGVKLELHEESSADCATASRPDKKVWFMFFNYRLVRIDADALGITTVEGAEVGITEAALRKIYGKRAKFRVHPYGDEPNDHYVEVALPARNRLLIFETWGKRVQSFRIGTQDAAPLIEGCS